VVLSAVCRHAYTYEIVDPGGKLDGAAGERLVIMEPVRAESILWSTARYNALAQARGDLPIVPIQTRVGEVESYPAKPTSVDGFPLTESEMVFPSQPTFQVADTGTVAWWLYVSETETTSEQRELRIGGSASVSAVAGYEYSLTEGIGSAYAVSVGFGTVFYGSVPAIEDDASTPEDEHVTRGYSFTPYMYRHLYLDPSGKEAGFFALSYTVNKRPAL
jgi:hypothetical protein